MSGHKWQASADLLALFQAIGRASLSYDIQDSHSGNMAVRFAGEGGAQQVAITATGSQKGDLEPSQICFVSPTETDYGYYKASSETDFHTRILTLPGVQASMHAHVKELTMATLDDVAKPSQPPAFEPVDPLAYHHLGPSIPVDWFAVPSGSPEMTKTIPDRLRDHALTLIFGHGAVTKGRSLKETFFRLCIANEAGGIVRQMWKLGVDVAALRAAIQRSAPACFADAPAAYDESLDGRCDFAEEDEILKEFHKAGHRIFESRLSPFHTGSMSIRGVDSMLWAPKASMPKDIGGPLLRVPLKAAEGDDPEIRRHKEIYAASDFQTVMHCYVREAEASAHYVYPGERSPAERVIPIDAEGTFLYLVIPVAPPDVSSAALLRLLQNYKVVIVRGGGVWAVGSQSLSEVLHHPSSVREICLYRIAAVERGLDLRKMEPAKAKRW
jgi:ribulose-5-phosphate 4-epimerase/fuculose-1-phosphate aldolase